MERKWKALILVDGYNGGVAHITADQIRDHNIAMYGNGDYVLPVGDKLAYEIVNNNTINMSSGMVVMNGARAVTGYGKTEVLTIENGTSGYKRADIIVAEYSKDNETLVESVTVKVVKGTLGSAYSDPALVTGDIRAGATKRQMALYRVKVNGLSIEAVEKMWTAAVQPADLNPSELIPSGANLNTYTAPGTYLSENKTISASLTNCPHMTIGFTLLVMRVASSDYRQILIANGGQCLVYMRHFTTSGTFDKWVKMGTVTMKKVWANASPTSTFKPQNVTITDDDYNAIDMVFLFSTKYAQIVGKMRIWLNTTRRHILNATWGSNITRGVSPSKSNGKIILNVEAASNYQSASNSSSDNSYAIPLEAYGVKGVI